MRLECYSFKRATDEIFLRPLLLNSCIYDVSIKYLLTKCSLFYKTPLLLEHPPLFFCQVLVPHHYIPEIL